jgi:hypothetical protein
MKTIVVAVLMLFAAASSAAAEPELAVHFGRATASKDVDIGRLTYRRALEPDARWWWPTHLQLGASVWRVPDISRRTRRYDLNLTPVWRADRGRGYLEAGIGTYFLSRTIRNQTTSLPSELQFGSHVGAGLRLGARGQAAVGIAFQHLSNAGIKEPNGGIDFVLLTASFQL